MRRIAAPVAVAAGVLLGPLLGALLSIGTAPALLVSAVLLTAGAVAGAVGLVRAVRRRRAARAAAVAVEEGPLTRFAAPEQTGSAALAVLLLAAAGVTAALHAAAQGSSSELGRQIGPQLALVPGLLVAGACAVPVLLLQARWTRRPGAPEAEAAVLAGRVPGARRRIVAGRAVTMLVWVLATALAGALAAATGASAVGTTAAALAAYSPLAASRQVGVLLSVEGYLASDVRCPATAPDPFVATTIRCSLRTLGRSRTIAVTWSPSGAGGGEALLQPGAQAGLARVRDLPPPPASGALPADLSSRAIERAVRAQLVAEGFDVARAPLDAIACPSISAGPDGGSVRCTLGRGYGVRYLEVYPDGRRITARTSMLADLPHR